VIAALKKHGIPEPFEIVGLHKGQFNRKGRDEHKLAPDQDIDKHWLLNNSEDKAVTEDADMNRLLQLAGMYHKPQVFETEDNQEGDQSPLSDVTDFVADVRGEKPKDPTKFDNTDGQKSILSEENGEFIPGQAAILIPATWMTGPNTEVVIQGYNSDNGTYLVSLESTGPGDEGESIGWYTADELTTPVGEATWQGAEDPYNWDPVMRDQIFKAAGEENRAAQKKKGQPVPNKLDTGRDLKSGPAPYRRGMQEDDVEEDYLVPPKQVDPHTNEEDDWYDPEDARRSMSRMGAHPEFTGKHEIQKPHLDTPAGAQAADDEWIVNQNAEQEQMAAMDDWDAFNKQGVEEEGELGNGYGEHHVADADDYFPTGNASNAAKDVGPSGARHGNNPMSQRMRTAESARIYEQYKRDFEDFKKK
jgi:hypothetical protein